MYYGPPGSGPWDFPGKNTGMGCHFLLQKIFPTQGSNPSLLHWQAVILPLNHKRSPFSVFCSVTQSCPTLCNPIDCSTPGLCPSPPPRVCPSACPLNSIPLCVCVCIHTYIYIIKYYSAIYRILYVVFHYSSHSGILLGHKKEWNNAIYNNRDGPRDCHLNEVSQKKKNKYHMSRKQKHRYRGGGWGKDGLGIWD